MAADLTFGRNDTFMPKGQRPDGQLDHRLPADPRRRIRIVVALHPDERRRVRHVGQPLRIRWVESRRSGGVVETVAERNDGARLPAPQLRRQPVERDAGIHGGSSMPRLA